ncbi:MAG: ATP-dependent zinc metalloprotease FtsH [Chlamydiota bacterium]
MSNDNNSKPEKKGFPGGFLILMLGVFFVILIAQSMNAEKGAKVSFSHQVEHLVNLELIQPQDSSKVALNDNLVTFSGKFKDNLSEEGKARYRYLELLNSNHEIQATLNGIGQELNVLSQNLKDAADWFLHISGLVIPQAGYRVVGAVYDTEQRQNAVVITKLSDRSVVSLVDMQQKFAKLPENPSEEQLSSFSDELLTLVHGFRSPVLGIGNEEIKQSLQALQKDLSSAPKSKVQFGKALSSLQGIVTTLNKEEGGIRLLQLRSVRNYQTTLKQYNADCESFDKNNAELDKARQSVSQVVWFFNNKELSSRSLEKQDSEAFSQWYAQAKQEWDQFAVNRGATFKAPDQPRTLVLDRTFKSEQPSPNYLSYLLTLMPVILVVLLLYFVFSRQMKGVGSGAMTFGKSPAKLITKEKNKITFKDVAGCDEAKGELQEIVDFLKDPTKFTALGARIPKGVLCIGAPGTGKTLIAKAVAGEADRPFFSISGSDFVEMFVGVGASRIRDLFEQAKKQAPCIIFMDEIDAVGRHRGAGMGGGHDEREQTLNQLLVEMDGFDTTEGVILIAATNRPDVLDKALLRPGRFDRRVVIDLPDIKGRFEILQVHAKKIKMDPSVNLMNIARNTPGSSGADLANMLNEAALLAASKGRSAVADSDVAEACDKVRYGKERRSLEIDQKEKMTTAIHESGHAIVALFVKYSDSVDKVTIIPRGLSLGATHFMPKKNRVNYWKKEILDQLAILMGGRVAEEIFLGDISSGAQMDITQATRLVRSMVCEWGMTDKLGTVAYDEKSEGGKYLGMQSYQEKTYSEETARAIDEEVRKILGEAYELARTLITEHKEQLQLMTDMLMEFETLDREDVILIKEGHWDQEKKKEKEKAFELLHRKLPPVPPTSMDKKEGKSSFIDPAPQQI